VSTPEAGVVLLDKDEGQSSFAALGTLKRQFNTRKVGHTGTLDPMATGLIVALIGPATRCARFFTGLDKTYLATVRFGTATDTDDRTGEVIREAALPSMQEAARLVREFVGEITQVPPAYSALHIDGRRAYERARAGEEVDMPSRQVTISDIAGHVVDERTLDMTVTCSSGTYIRSLARDLGAAAGSAAHLVALRRTRVGPFDVSEVANGSAGFHLLALAQALPRLPGITPLDVDDTIAAAMWHGKRVALPAAGVGPTVLALHEGMPVAVGHPVARGFEYEIVFPRPEPAHG